MDWLLQTFVLSLCRKSWQMEKKQSTLICWKNSSSSLYSSVTVHTLLTLSHSLGIEHLQGYGSLNRNIPHSCNMLNFREYVATKAHKKENQEGFFRTGTFPHSWKIYFDLGRKCGFPFKYSILITNINKIKSTFMSVWTIPRTIEAEHLIKAFLFWTTSHP